MEMASDVNKIRISVDLFDDEKIDSILNLEDGDAVFMIWFRLFLKIKKKGTNIYSEFSGINKPIRKILSIILKEPEKTVTYAMAELTKLGMVEVNGNEIKVIVPWLSNQYYRTTPDYINWRVGVFERDAYTCRHCGTTGNVLNAHHIMSFSGFKTLRYEVSNGLTLCEKCHKEEHKRLRKVDINA